MNLDAMTSPRIGCATPQGKRQVGALEWSQLNPVGRRDREGGFHLLSIEKISHGLRPKK
jgi:hypothetical protein